ncbi:MAG: ATP synthase subunit I [Pseudomonadota bacterium]
MKLQQNLLKFVVRTNWILFCLVSILGYLFASPKFAIGIISGGLIVTINFHLLYKTLKKSLTPPHLASHNVVLAKYYVRFAVSGVIIFILISGHYVNPLGLFIGLSVVVASIMIAAILEFKKLIFKEAI